MQHLLGQHRVARWPAIGDTRHWFEEHGCQRPRGHNIVGANYDAARLAHDFDVHAGSWPTVAATGWCAFTGSASLCVRGHVHAYRMTSTRRRTSTKTAKL